MDTPNAEQIGQVRQGENSWSPLMLDTSNAEEKEASTTRRKMVWFDLMLDEPKAEQMRHTQQG